MRVKLEVSTAEELVSVAQAIQRGETVIFEFNSPEDAKRNLTRRPLGSAFSYVLSGSEVWVSKKTAAQ